MGSSEEGPSVTSGCGLSGGPELLSGRQGEHGHPGSVPTHPQGLRTPKSLRQPELMSPGRVRGQETEAGPAQIFSFGDICCQPVHMKMCGRVCRDDMSASLPKLPAPTVTETEGYPCHKGGAHQHSRGAPTSYPCPIRRLQEATVGSRRRTGWGWVPRQGEPGRWQDPHSIWL